MNGQVNYNDLNDFLNNLPKSFSILEEKIDVEIQVSYFDYIKRNKIKSIENEIIDTKIDLLLSHLDDSEQVKELLVGFARTEDVKIYRALEKFVSETKNDLLKSWAILALQENRMLIESSLLEERQVFISTGLGGKGQHLRYFLAGFLNSKTEFKSYEKEAIQKEFEFILGHSNSTLEKIEFKEHFVLMHALIPLQEPIKELLLSAIEECKALGIDLSEHFVVTNVKELSIDELNKIIDEKFDFLETDEENFDNA
ncbi:MAG: hypothetical protein JXR60_00830 [Bacteroidales bacterium]|nr:hypothetical protein [Bacteroidales bacterium]